MSESASSGTEVRFVIEYTGSVNGKSLRGQLVNGDGNVTSTWTDDQGNAQDVDVTEEAFRELWNGVSDLEVFKNHLVKKPPKDLDGDDKHLIEVVFQGPGNSVKQLYVIPDDNDDVDFAAWLTQLAIP